MNAALSYANGPTVQERAVRLLVSKKSTKTAIGIKERHLSRLSEDLAALAPDELHSVILDALRNSKCADAPDGLLAAVDIGACGLLGIELKDAHKAKVGRLAAVARNAQVVPEAKGTAADIRFVAYWLNDVLRRKFWQPELQARILCEVIETRIGRLPNRDAIEAALTKGTDNPRLTNVVIAAGILPKNITRKLALTRVKRAVDIL